MNRRLHKIFYLAVVTALVWSTLPTAAFAEMEEIIVTAQRREQNLQDVPVAVSAFTAEQMETRQLSELLDMMDKIPNLMGFHNTGPGSANSMFMRGIGSPDSIATFDPPVAMYVDDVLITRTAANNYALFDVERIEFLRGPQGTTFGRNTTAGVFHVITRRPGDKFAFRGRLDYGSYGRISVNGSVDIPLSPKVLTKLSAFFVEDDGFVDNLTTGEKTNYEESQGIRGEVRLLPTDRITWDLALEYMELNGINVGTSVGEKRAIRTGIRKAGTPGNLEDLTLRGLGLGNETETFSIYSHLRFDIEGIGNLEFITGYRDTDWNYTIDFANGPTPWGGFAIVNQSNHKQFTQEVKLTGEFKLGRFPIDYLAGLFYMDEDNRTEFTDVVPGPTILISRILDNTTENFSAFAQFDIGLTDRLMLQAGVRWTDETKDIAYTTRLEPFIFGAFNVASLTGGVTTENVQASGNPIEMSTDRLTPRVALQYKATKEVMLYVSATNGFKSGGWNARGGDPAAIRAFDIEKVWSYDAGVKGDFFEDRLRVNANAFFFDVKGLQLVTGFPDPRGGPAPLFVTGNAGNLEVTGLEADFFADLAEGLGLYGSVGFMFNAEYKNVIDISGVLTDDTDPQRTPDITAALGISYTFPVEALGGNLFFGLEGQYQDDNFKVSGRPESFQKAYSTWSVRAGWKSEDGRWSVVGECKNCTDEEYLTSYFILPYYGSPKRWNIGLRVNY